MLSMILLMANGGRGPTRLGSGRPSWMSMPKRWPSATGSERARLTYSNTSCSAGVGSPESYSTAALTVGPNTPRGNENAVKIKTVKTKGVTRLRFKDMILVQLRLEFNIQISCRPMVIRANATIMRSLRVISTPTFLSEAPFSGSNQGLTQLSHFVGWVLEG